MNEKLLKLARSFQKDITGLVGFVGGNDFLSTQMDEFVTSVLESYGISENSSGNLWDVATETAWDFVQGRITFKKADRILSQIRKELNKPI